VGANAPGVDPARLGPGLGARLAGVLAPADDGRRARQLAARLDAIMGSVGQAIVFADDGAHVGHVNAAAALLLGVPEGAVPSAELADAMAALRARAANAAALERRARDLVGVADWAVAGWEWEYAEPTRVLRVTSRPVHESQAHDGSAVAGRVWTFDDITAERVAVRELAAHNDALEEANVELETLTEALERVNFELEGMNRDLAEVNDELAATNGDLVTAREAAESASRAKGDFVARVNHELRSPLTAIIGFTRLLLADRVGVLPPAARDFVARVDQNSRHLLALVNDILDMAKLESGKVDLDLAPVTLPALVDEALATLGVQAQGKGLVLAREIAPDLPLVLADALKLKQVLINLLGNAVKFTAAGSVTVRVARAPLAAAEAAEDTAARPALVLEVADTGIGIPADRQGAVFEAFEQAHAAAPQRFGGTGLGLAIARQLCVLMGMTLTLESEPGVGSLFRIAVPERLLVAAEPAGEAPLALAGA
jgi:signal transduction histidine kinase